MENGRNGKGIRGKDFYRWSEDYMTHRMSSGAFALQQQIQHSIRQQDHQNVRPPDQDTLIWQYEHLRQFVIELNILIAKLQHTCTCPIMNATSEWVYLCAAHPQPKECCALDYMVHTLDGIQHLLTSAKCFPSRVSLSEDARSYFPSVSRRLYRIFAHAYFHHPSIFHTFETTRRTCHRFVTFVKHHELIPSNLLIIPDLDSPRSLQTSGVVKSTKAPVYI